MEKIANVNNCDGVQVEVTLTSAEVAQLNADQKLITAKEKAQSEAEIVAIAARQLVLDKLGLTAEEIAALLS